MYFTYFIWPCQYSHIHFGQMKILLIFLIAGLTIMQNMRIVATKTTTKTTVSASTNEIANISLKSNENGFNVELPKPMLMLTNRKTVNNSDDSFVMPTLMTPKRQNRAFSHRPTLMDVALQVSAREGLNAMTELYGKILPNIVRNGHLLEDNHPAALLSKFSESTSETLQQEMAAYATISATKAFRKNYKYFNDLARQTHTSKVSLRHTALEGLCPPRDPPTCMPASARYRTHDGTCNSSRRPRWGAAQMPFNRFLPPEYGDGVDSIRMSVDGGPLASSRFVSLLVHGARDGEAAVTLMTAQWGQLLDHDMTSTAQPRSINGSVPSCCGNTDFHPSCFPIKVPLDDPWLAPLKVRCLEFLRSAPAQRRDCILSWREQTNQATSYIDASPIYSNSVKSSDNARVFRNGLLVFGRGNPSEDACQRGAIATHCIRAGDGRSGEQPGLLALHHVWVGEHNRIAMELSELNLHWSDEKIYQEARRIVGAMFQHITYREFLPIVLGREVCKLFDLELISSGYFEGYDPKTNPTIANSFAAAAFRFGHSLVQNSYMRCDRFHNFMRNNVSLHEEFRRGDIGSPGSLHRLLRGLVNQRALKRDEFITPELTNHLFQTPGFPFGLDLAAINIQRGRDHGVPPYTAWRVPCGLTPINTWEEFANVVGPQSAHRISHAYRSVHDIDLFVAGIAERPVVGGLVGPTFACIIAQQFSNSRKGDRFWYENGGFESSFTPAQLSAIRYVSLSQILCRAVGGGTIQPHVFLPTEVDGNERQVCGTGILTPLDLSPWREQDPFASSHPITIPTQEPDRAFNIITTNDVNKETVTSASLQVVQDNKIGFPNRLRPTDNKNSLTGNNGFAQGVKEPVEIIRINDKLDLKQKVTPVKRPTMIAKPIKGINNKIDKSQTKIKIDTRGETVRRPHTTRRTTTVVFNNIPVELRSATSIENRENKLINKSNEIQSVRNVPSNTEHLIPDRKEARIDDRDQNAPQELPIIDNRTKIFENNEVNETFGQEPSKEEHNFNGENTKVNPTRTKDKVTVQTETKNRNVQRKEKLESNEENSTNHPRMTKAEANKKSETRIREICSDKSEWSDNNTVKYVKNGKTEINDKEQSIFNEESKTTHLKTARSKVEQQNSNQKKKNTFHLRTTEIEALRVITKGRKIRTSRQTNSNKQNNTTISGTTEDKKIERIETVDREKRNYTQTKTKQENNATPPRITNVEANTQTELNEMTKVKTVEQDEAESETMHTENQIQSNKDPTKPINLSEQTVKQFGTTEENRTTNMNDELERMEVEENSRNDNVNNMSYKLMTINEKTETKKYQKLAKDQSNFDTEKPMLSWDGSERQLNIDGDRGYVKVRKGIENATTPTNTEPYGKQLEKNLTEGQKINGGTKILGKLETNIDTIYSDENKTTITTNFSNKNEQLITSIDTDIGSETQRNTSNCEDCVLNNKTTETMHMTAQEADSLKNNVDLTDIFSTLLLQKPTEINIHTREREADTLSNTKPFESMQKTDKILNQTEHETNSTTFERQPTTSDINPINESPQLLKQERTEDNRKLVLGKAHSLRIDTKNRLHVKPNKVGTLTKMSTTTKSLKRQTTRTPHIKSELRQYQTQPTYYTRPQKVIVNGPNSDQYEIEINIRPTNQNTPPLVLAVSAATNPYTSYPTTYKPYGYDRYTTMNYLGTYKPANLATVSVANLQQTRRTKPPTIIYVNENDDRYSKTTTRTPSFIQNIITFASTGLGNFSKRPQQQSSPHSTPTNIQKEHSNYGVVNPIGINPIYSPHTGAYSTSLNAPRPDNQLLSASYPVIPSTASLSQVGGVASSGGGAVHASSGAISSGNFGTITGVAQANAVDSTFSFNIRPKPHDIGQSQLPLPINHNNDNNGGSYGLLSTQQQSIHSQLPNPSFALMNTALSSNGHSTHFGNTHKAQSNSPFSSENNKRPQQENYYGYYDHNRKLQLQLKSDIELEPDYEDLAISRTLETFENKTSPKNVTNEDDKVERKVKDNIEGENENDYDYEEIDLDRGETIKGDDFITLEHFINTVPKSKENELKNLTSNINCTTKPLDDNYVLPILNTTTSVNSLITEDLHKPSEKTKVTSTTKTMRVENVTNFPDIFAKYFKNDILAEDEYDPEIKIEPIVETQEDKETNIGYIESNKPRSESIAFAPIKILNKLERPDNWLIYDSPINYTNLPKLPEMYDEDSPAPTNEIPKPFRGLTSLWLKKVQKDKERNREKDALS